MLDPPNLRRRDWLKIGVVALGGQPLNALVRSASAANLPPPRAKACILLYMDGGPSHLDLWDLKPDAPAEIRGPYSSIATSVPGTRVCELLPMTAGQMHRLVQIRSVCHQATVHDPAVYQMLTGYKHLSSAGNLKVEETDFPQMGPAFGAVDRAPAAMPKVIELPETMKMEARVLPGQNAGFLGGSYDPFRVEVTREEARVVKPSLGLLPHVTRERLGRIGSLVERYNRELAWLEATAQVRRFDQYQQQALALLSRPSVQEAFDVEREPAEVHERYGRNRHGQAVLLARRLVEGGAKFVTVYWGKEEQDWADGKGPRLANNPWDTHRNHFPLVRDSLVPRSDRALSALVSDLAERGLLEETLVVWMGDFGRTPKIDKKYASRDHWPFAFTVLMAGAGLNGGAIYGRTDRHAAHVTDSPVSPADLTATIYSALGADPSSEIRDSRGKSYRLSEGKPLARLWS
ncbi:MAG TPA: DUF1501 domain-containing protein [Pirellulales bacterium]|nr:DUF1501 domain-containing protein [Pirellulales bacterium]